MTDIVTFLKTYCDNNDIHFVYGQKAALNLLDARVPFPTDQVYFMLEPFRRVDVLTQNSGVTIATTQTITFFLVVNSDLDMPIFNEVGNNENDGKYKTYVQPLIATNDAIKKYIGCSSDVSIINSDWIDAYNLFDQNKDGILVTYNLRVSI
jgi:hypothetical protein